MEVTAAKQIFLTGFMASGKSTIGRGLAANLGLKFVDLDKEIEQFTGKTIAELFEQEGEAEFRKLEVEILAQIGAKSNDFVMATGGGTICTAAAYKIMQKGFIVYLELPFEILLGRLRQNRRNRPLVATKTDEELAKFVELKLKERLPFYQKADVKIDAKNVKLKDLAKNLSAQLK